MVVLVAGKWLQDRSGSRCCLILQGLQFSGEILIEVDLLKTTKFATFGFGRHWVVHFIDL